MKFQKESMWKKGKGSRKLMAAVAADWTDCYVFLLMMGRCSRPRFRDDFPGFALLIGPACKNAF
jgi:hypothetical protein